MASYEDLYKTSLPSSSTPVTALSDDDFYKKYPLPPSSAGMPPIVGGPASVDEAARLAREADMTLKNPAGVYMGSGPGTYTPDASKLPLLPGTVGPEGLPPPDAPPLGGADGEYGGIREPDSFDDKGNLISKPDGGLTPGFKFPDSVPQQGGGFPAGGAAFPPAPGAPNPKNPSWKDLSKYQPDGPPINWMPMNVPQTGARWTSGYGPPMFPDGHGGFQAGEGGGGGGGGSYGGSGSIGGGFNIGAPPNPPGATLPGMGSPMPAAGGAMPGAGGAAGGVNGANDPTWGNVTGPNGQPIGGVPPGTPPQSPLVGDLAKTYQAQSDAANAKNEQRYDQILAGYDKRTNNGFTELKNLNNQNMDDVTNLYTQRRGQAEQDLTDRGLGNTTVRSSVMQGLTGQEAMDRARIQDANTLQRVGAMSGLTGDTLGFMERRNDQGPDMAGLAALAQGVGQAGVGGPVPGGAPPAPGVGGGVPGSPYAQAPAPAPGGMPTFFAGPLGFNGVDANGINRVNGRAVDSMAPAMAWGGGAAYNTAPSQAQTSPAAPAAPAPAAAAPLPGSTGSDAYTQWLTNQSKPPASALPQPGGYQNAINGGISQEQDAKMAQQLPAGPPSQNRAVNAGLMTQAQADQMAELISQGYDMDKIRGMM